MANFWRDREADAISTYWNAVTDSQTWPDRPANEIDATLLDTIARIREGRQRHIPDSAFVDRLETTLMNTQVSSIAVPPPRLKEMDVRPDWLPSRDAWFPRKWSLAAVATIALVAITLAAFFFSLRDSNQPAFVPGTPVVAPTATAVPAETVAPVTMYRGNAARTGEMPGPGPASQPQVLWRFQTNGEVHSIPAFADGVLYGGGGAGYLYAMDASTGEEIWEWFANGPVYSPAVVDGTVYVGAWDSNFYAIDTATGDELWHAPGLGDNSSPAIVDGVVYVGSDDGFVTALRASDGSVIWETTMPAAIFRSVTIAEGKVFAGAEDGSLYALDISTGNQVWSFATGFDEAQTASVVDGVVYVTGQAADNGTAFALNASDGTEIWRFATDTRIKFGSAEISDGTVYLGDIADTVYAIDAATGAERWTSQVDDTLSGLPAMVDGVLYVGANQTLYAIDMVTGERLWQLDVGEPFIGQVIVTGGTIYFATGLGSYMAVGVGNGSNPVIHAPRIPTATVPATPDAAATPETGSATAASSPVAGESVEFLWETTGGDGGFASPSTLAFAPDGTIWVADAGNARFQIFDRDGNFIESWTGTGDGQFGLVQPDGNPYGAVAFAADGSFYVLDPGARRVLVFAADRTFLRSIGQPGRGPGEFASPTSIGVDPAGNLAVLDPARRDIQTFAPDGTVVATAPLQSTHSGATSMNLMIIDGDGNFLVAEQSANLSLPRLVEKFDAEGNLLQQFGDESGPGSFGRSINEQFDDQPVGIGIDAAGNIYVTEIGNNPRVVVFSADGTYLMEIGAAGSATVTFDFPGDVLLDDQGNVYVTDLDQNRLVKLRLPQSLAPATPTS